jgi:hypothetical protein
MPRTQILLTYDGKTDRLTLNGRRCHRGSALALAQSRFGKRKRSPNAS